MSINEAFSVLGSDMQKIFNYLKSKPIRIRGQEANVILEKLKKKAKILMAKSHPDVCGNSDNFHRLKAAIKIIEDHTVEFNEKLKDHLASKPKPMCININQ